jgi:hypothetical protein
MIEKVIACKFVTLSLTARVLKNETLTLNVKPKAMKHEAITTHFLAQNKGIHRKIESLAQVLLIFRRTFVHNIP